MGKTYEEIEQYETDIDLAIDTAMEGIVTENAKVAIQDSVASHVYSYNPIFLSRWNTSGGLRDTSTMRDDYDSGSKTLTITMETEWQNRGFRYIDGRGTYDDLADAVENNQIYNAPPRKFMKPAEDEYSHGQFEADLMSVLGNL